MSDLSEMDAEAQLLLLALVVAIGEQLNSERLSNMTMEDKVVVLPGGEWADDGGPDFFMTLGQFLDALRTLRYDYRWLLALRRKQLESALTLYEQLQPVIDLITMG